MSTHFLPCTNEEVGFIIYTGTHHQGVTGSSHIVHVDTVNSLDQCGSLSKGPTQPSSELTFIFKDQPLQEEPIG